MSTTPSRPELSSRPLPVPHRGSGMGPAAAAAAPSRFAASTWMVLALLGPLALFLAWRVLTLGMADLWVDSKPERALFWRPDDPQALFEAADDDYMNRNFAGAKALALRTVANYPLDGRAYRELADVADFFGDHSNARRLYDTAVRLAPRDIATHGKLLGYEMQAGQIQQALRHADLLLRLQPDIMPDLLPRLGSVSGNPAVLTALRGMLKERPPWRDYFLAILAESGSDPAAIDRVFASRGDDDPLPLHPPQMVLRSAGIESDDVSGFTEADLLINRQVADGRWGSAYVTWVGTLSPAQRVVVGNLYDGGFTFPPVQKKIGWLHLSGKSFGWQVPDRGTGFDVRIAPRTQYSNDNALQVTFDGLPIDFQPVKQLLVLGPGHYRLSGMGQAGAVSEYGIQWVVACAEGDATLLGKSTAFTGDIPWGPFQMEFDVPVSDSAATACGGQWLRLDVADGIFKGEPLEGGAIFDNLKIDRLGPPIPPPADGKLPGSAAAGH